MTAEDEAHAIRVYLIDDHDVVRYGIRRLLETGGDVEIVGETGSARTGVARVPASRPDVVLLDLRLPDGDGIEVCRAIRAVDANIRVIILTAHEDDVALCAAVLAGASGYVLKHVSLDTLVDDVRLVHAGASLLDPDAVTKIQERLDRAAHELPKELRDLSRQELVVLRRVARGETNAQIAEQLTLAEKTVKNHVSHVLAKLGLQRRTEAALLAVRLLGEQGADRPTYGGPSTGRRQG